VAHDEDDGTARTGSAEHVLTNREHWDAEAAAYQAKHTATLPTDGPITWGVWAISDDDLAVLSDVDWRGLDLLELGCGAGQWGMRLARQGARVIGIDNSLSQLQHGQRLQQDTGVAFPLLQADAERLPFADASFDVVACDWGAMSFADPFRTVPEATRVLRPGGTFAFSTFHPFEWLSYDSVDQHNTTTLLNDYFEQYRWDDEDGTVLFNLTFQDWIGLFSSNGLVVVDVAEPQAPDASASTYRDESDRAWAKRWPAEIIWRLRRTG